ncbi:DUF3149 domain-containing protein [Kingella kingae]|uniref:Uncharacterized protein n=1 Tax=Kingella kingae ATCC 23330 TaxID=887327 RepID=F5S6M4_KINKI|nr:DUF3149 domain-containing protein [Kingella kingae]EGK09661.1 hypothetical protein HMPREF0476_0857 [Kingella kingae ATCC 23330]
MYQYASSLHIYNGAQSVRYGAAGSKQFNYFFWRIIMDVFAQLFKSPVGMMSLATIAFIIVIAVFMFFWVKKQADNDKK